MGLERFRVSGAPFALGTYSHAVVVDGKLIYTAGLSGRDPKTNLVPGVKLNERGERVAYDMTLETRACLENLKTVIEGAGGSMKDIIEVSVYLTDMRDFEAYNKVFAEYFQGEPPSRTTVGVSTLPGPLAIEMKAVGYKRAQ